MSPDRAVAHKDYDVFGGGERLAEQLAATTAAPLYVGHKNTDRDPAVPIREIAPDSRAHWAADRGGLVRSLGHIRLWRDHARHHIQDYDTIIASGNEPLWYVGPDDQTIIAYTHSPPRWMYDLHHEVDGLLRRTFNQCKRRFYEGGIRRVDHFVANSDLVARRIQRYWSVPDDRLDVVYPPVAVEQFTPTAAPNDEQFVVVSRLAEHKRLEVVIEAAEQAGVPLVVAGKGPDRERLEAISDEATTKFVGYVSEQRKRELVASARGFLNAAANEDFCMATIEAMAAGTPVITVNDGFPAYQVRDGDNGVVADGDGTADLAAAIQRFEQAGVDWRPDRISAFADRFSVPRFNEEITSIVERVEQRTRVEPEWHQREPTPTTGSPAVADGGQPNE